MVLGINPPGEHTCAVVRIVSEVGMRRSLPAPLVGGLQVIMICLSPKTGLTGRQPLGARTWNSRTQRSPETPLQTVEFCRRARDDLAGSSRSILVDRVVGIDPAADTHQVAGAG